MIGLKDLVLWNVSIIDGRSPSPREGMRITVSAGRIAGVSRAAGAGPPDGAIDLGGRWVLPGLIDAHVHLTDKGIRLGDMALPKPLEGEGPRPRELGYFVLANSARAFLRGGITTVRDVGCYDDGAIILREAIRLGLTEGPTVLACGRIISATAPGGRIFDSMYEEADGPWEMRRCVRRQVQRGADYVKVMAGGARSVAREDPEKAQLTKEEMDAVVDEAHRLGIRVAAHAEGLAQVRLAVESGVDTIEHGLSLHRAPDLLETMAKRGTVLVPTLTTFHDLAERFADQFVPELVEQARRQQEEARSTVMAAHQAGVTMAMGFDSGPPGADALELVRMVDAGLPTHDAISAATIGSACALGLRDVGTIEAGRVADLVVLAANPLLDIAALTRLDQVWMVVKAGRIVPR